MARNISTDRQMSLRMAISDLIHGVRCDNHITQEELANRAGISYEHLNHIENYKATPSIEVLDKLARSLGFTHVSQFLAHDKKHIL